MLAIRRHRVPPAPAAAAILAAALLLALAPAPAARAAQAPAPAGRPSARATFAAGCFWCVQEAFEKVPGVVSVAAGYTGGTVPNPTYEQVSAGDTGHKEAVEVVYDPSKVSYSQLLDFFWHNADPTDGSGQFCDRGPEYRAQIFYHDEAQRKLAEASKQALERTKTFKEPIVTEITPAGPFYRAEEYHQDYYKKNPLRYKFYRFNCGRDRRLQELWGRPGD
jgi:peptide-methionine (S)-S-oxide reductase